jgi:hypothetical protein
MKRLLKTLLIWLVIATLPSRVLASVDTSCPQTASMPPAGILAQAHDAIHHGAAHAPADSAVHGGDKDSARDFHVKNAGCSGTVCFLGASAPPLHLTWLSPCDNGKTANPVQPAAFNGHISAPIEHPPRHFHV